MVKRVKLTIKKRLMVSILKITQVKEVLPQKVESVDTEILTAINEIQEAFMEVTGTVKDARSGGQVLTIPRRNLKEVAEASGNIDQGDIDDVLNKLITDEASIDGEALSISELENNIITGTYSKGSYTRLTKNILLKNYVNVYNASKSKSVQPQVY